MPNVAVRDLLALTEQNLEEWGQRGFADNLSRWFHEYEVWNPLHCAALSMQYGEGGGSVGHGLH